MTITLQPALAPSPQPRPAPTARALPPEPVAQKGQNWTPIGGQIWKPIDTRTSLSSLRWHPGTLGRTAKELESSAERVELAKVRFDVKEIAFDQLQTIVERLEALPWI